jgi:phenylpropionate dioxygenase-like ring-hydroxylating dioxygenase large terminal subunit
MQKHMKSNQPDIRQTGLHPDFWYPLARSASLKKGKMLSVSFAGEVIVLVRKKDGDVFALENRCAHRQIPLSMGGVEGNRLKCGYHAWEYEDTGRVAKIPYLVKDSPAPPRCIRNYPCKEAYDHIFVYTGDPKKLEHISFPELPVWHRADFRTMYFEREVGCHYSFMHENLMDMNHQFLHRRLLGGLKPTLIEYCKGESWIEARYKFESGGKRKIGADFLMDGSKKGTDSDDEDIMTIRTDYPYQSLTLQRSGDEEPALHLWSVYIPVTRDQRTHKSFGMLMIKKPPIPGLIYLFWPFMRWFTERVFSEDRMAVMAEQQAYDRQGGDWNNEVFPLILDLRNVLIRNGIPLGEAD